MSRENKKFVRLSDLADRKIVMGKMFKTTIRFDVGSMPNYTNPDGSVLQDNIGINLKALRRRAVLAGISDLRVITVAGDTTKFVPSAVARNRDGTAVAGQTGVLTKQKTYGVGEDGDTHIIRLNVSEMSERKPLKSNLRSAKTWAKEMNKAIESALLSHQVKTMKKSKGQYVGAIESALALYTGYENPLYLLNNFLVFSVVANIIAVYNKFIYGYHYRPFTFEATGIAFGLAAKDWLFGTKSLVRGMQPPKTTR